MQIVFGAVDEACTIWVNGRRVLERPYPYQGDNDSWQKAFQVDVTDVVHFEGPNVLVVRVEDNAGAGGIWKPVWLVQSEAGAENEQNAVRNGGFEQNDDRWRMSVMCGQFHFARDSEEKRNGAASGRITCTKALDEEPQRGWTGSWGRWFQTEIPVREAQGYRFRAWVKTGAGFSGTVAIWVRALETPRNGYMLNTNGVWREVVIDDIVPTGETAAVYLNLRDGEGSVWFDDIELVPVD